MYICTCYVCMVVYMTFYVQITPNKKEGGGGECMYIQMTFAKKVSSRLLCAYIVCSNRYNTLFYKPCDFHTSHYMHTHIHLHILTATIDDRSWS